MTEFHVDPGTLTQVSDDGREAGKTCCPQLAQRITGCATAGNTQETGIGNAGLATDRDAFEDADIAPAPPHQFRGQSTADDPTADDDDRG